MIASQIDASTRSEATSISALRPVVPSGAASRSASGTPMPLRDPRAGRAADRLGAHLGQAAGAVALEARVQVGGDRQAQDDVPQEREPLVGVGAVLHPGRVGEGLPAQVLRQLGEQLRE